MGSEMCIRDRQYIVMEYVDGMTLREYLNERGGKLTSRETVHFISQILKALDHAHRNGEISAACGQLRRDEMNGKA